MPLQHESVKIRDDECDEAEVSTGDLHVDVSAIIPGSGATNLGKAEDSPHTSGDVGVMLLAVRQDAATALAAAGDYIPVIVDANGRLHIAGLTQPFSAVLEGGLTELIGPDEQVDQNEYGASVDVALAGTYSGEILHVTFYTYQTGAGAILEPEGWLFVFDADPTIAAGDAAMTYPERLTVIGQIQVTDDDWQSDANGASATIQCQPIAFHSLATLYFAFFLTSAAGFNDAGGDNEHMDFAVWYRRDS